VDVNTDYRYAPRQFDDAFPVFANIRWRYRPGAQMSKCHVHETLEVGWCHSGSGIIVCGEKTLEYGKGDVFVVNRYEPHFGRSSDDEESIWSWIHFDPLKLCGGLVDSLEAIDDSRYWGPDFTNVIPSHRSPRLGTIVSYMVEELREKWDGHRAAVRNLAALAMTELHRHHAPVTVPEATHPDRHALQQINPALELMSKDLGCELDIASLARACCTSPSALRRHFVAALGIPPRTYRRRLRMAAARVEVARDRKQISQIAWDLGYNSPAAFCRDFRRYSGTSPRQYRKQHSDRLRG
jgi:AraC-like DNA-binding protein